MPRPRPKLHKISEEMKVWSAILTEEVSSWPKVKLRSMFGFMAAYRSRKIFAALPKTRTMDPPDSISFKIPPNGKLRQLAARDAAVRISEKGSWTTYQLKSDQDVNAALQWLSRAYEAAGRSFNRGS